MFRSSLFFVRCSPLYVAFVLACCSLWCFVRWCLFVCRLVLVACCLLFGVSCLLCVGFCLLLFGVFARCS